MGFFSKNQNAEEKTAPRNPSSFIMFRILAVGYLGYLCLDLVKLYRAGGPDAPSLPMLMASLAVLGGGAIFVAIVSYKVWKQSKAEYDTYMAELRAEAEAKRAAEEAEAAALAAEDDYYESLEAAEADETE